jgi:hypothetical protein
MADHADDGHNKSTAKSNGSVRYLKFTGGPNPYGGNGTLIAAALAAVQGGLQGRDGRS